MTEGAKKMSGEKAPNQDFFWGKGERENVENLYIIYIY